MRSNTNFGNFLFLFTLLFTLIPYAANSQPNYPKSPDAAEIYFTDVEHFAEAYEALSTNPDTLGVLKSLYFDRATPGLTEFIGRHQLTPELLKTAMAASPERYAMIPAFLSNKAEIKNLHANLMREYHNVLPDAMYAPTWLLVGANRGIGQASKVGQLITITRVADNPGKLKKLMVHELSHFQQAMAMGPQKYGELYSQENNMLGLCLREGGAEFITSLVLDDITQTKALAYIDENEDELKEKFIRDLEKQDTEFWLWESLDKKDHPGLIGYAMGYKICKAYYDLAEDKDAALQDILRMENAEVFLRSSKYLMH